MLADKFKIYSVGPEVYNAIVLSNKHHVGKDTIILGDSVAKQLITEGLGNNADVIDLTCGQAVSLAGHYALLVNALKNNKQVKQVYLLYHIFSLSNNLNQIFTFNYFVKPFYAHKNNLFTSKTDEIIKSKPYWILYKLPITKVLPVFGNIDYTRKYPNKKFDNGLLLSPTSQEYICKMKSICESNNIDFKIYPTPLSVHHSMLLDSHNLFIDQVKAANLVNEFDGYLSKQIILSDAFYIEDYVHIKPEFVKYVSGFSLHYVGLLDKVHKQINQ